MLFHISNVSDFQTSLHVSEVKVHVSIMTYKLQEHDIRGALLEDFQRRINVPI